MRDHSHEGETSAAKAVDQSARGHREHPQEGQHDSRCPDDVVGVWRALGDLPAGAIVSEAALAVMFGRCKTSIKRAVRRGELPPPTRLMGMPVWTVSAILRHVETRLDVAKKDAEKLERRLGTMAP